MLLVFNVIFVHTYRYHFTVVYQKWHYAAAIINNIFASFLFHSNKNNKVNFIKGAKKSKVVGMCHSFSRTNVPRVVA